MDHENIDTTQVVYFYDDRNKYDYMFKLKEVLFQDADNCYCVAVCTDETNPFEEKILFNLKDGTVETSEYDSWYATNDVEWAEEENEYLLERGRESQAYDLAQQAKEAVKES